MEVIRGRDTELAVVDGLLRAAREGRSGALVLRGEAGIGKSAMLDHAASATGMRVVHGSGYETESELPYAGLHLLLARHLDRLSALPDRQREALAGALGLGPAGAGDRFLVGLAVLTVLADLAEDQPLVCLVDDAHWLDRASADALLFAARRLEAEGVAMLFAVRDVHAPAFPTPGLAELRLAGLDSAAAADLLTDRASDLPHHIRAQVLNESDGNPLALIELSAARRDGRLPTAPGTTTNRVQRAFADQVAALPVPAQTLLLVAAADDTGSAAVVLAAAERLGATVADLQPAEQASLVQHAGGRLVFRHPLIRAAVYQTAPLARRMAAHQALADTLDTAVEGHADRRAWHLAAVSPGPDEQVARALEASAESARRHGGYAEVAAAYERAAALTPDRSRRGRRLLAAASAAADAGLLERAGELAGAAADDLDDPLALAQTASIRATLADEELRLGTSHRLLLDAARSVAAHSPKTADDLLSHSIDTALIGCDLALVAESAEVAASVLPAGTPSRARTYARVVLGFAGDSSAEVGDGIQALRDQVAYERAHPPRLREAPLGQWWHEELGDDVAALAVAEAVVQDCRDRGAAGVLPLGLTVLARSQRYRGRHALARASAAEGLRVARDIGQAMSAVLLSNVLADLAATEGDEVACQKALSPLDLSHPMDAALSAGSLSLLDVGLGRYEPVLDRRAILSAGVNRTYTVFYLPDLIEAGARLGQPALVAEANAFYQAWATHGGQPWARAVAKRCEAFLSDAPERLFAEAAELHRAGGRPFERARTELAFGEWLRRERRRGDARGWLRSAAETFGQLSAHPWAERAHAELRAAGQLVAERSARPRPTASLTPQELQVVRLASLGLTNRDIGAQLFLSPRTIGYHLSNAYAKLGITSRADLRGMSLEEAQNGVE